MLSQEVMGPSNGVAHCEVLPMLIAIYGSRQIFADEYRIMLAERYPILASNKPMSSHRQAGLCAMLISSWDKR